jgi:3',5'-cyclic-nucleotide phosphodiesterase
MLYGHLNPEHLAAELTTLATEVVNARPASQTASGSRPFRKKQKKNPTILEDLRGALDGLRVFVTHCKDNLGGGSNLPVRRLIVQQVKTLVEEKSLGVEILAAEQGMRIGTQLLFSVVAKPDSVSLLSAEI